jgi:molybdopterin molybdotransferase
MKQLIRTREALELILQHKPHLSVCSVPLEKSEGRILAQKVIADRDFPPYHRVTMDGIALNSQALSIGVQSFQQAGIQFAGQEPLMLKDQHTCIEIMTGAVLPMGCDMVIRYEDLQKTVSTAGTFFSIQSGEHQKRQNIHEKGLDAKQGEVLIENNKKINENDVAIAAGCGYSRLKVKRKLRFLVVNTGNELVATQEKPKDHQIRMSNGILLETMIRKWGGKSTCLQVNDHVESLQKLIHDWEKKVDAILFTGGVSMGQSDFVPEVLKNEKYHLHFHGVQQRPGKPFLFATKAHCAVFGFPGNPVSVSVCANYYLRAWMHQAQWDETLVREKVILGKEIFFDKKLDYFLPVFIEKQSEATGIPIQINGSGDFINLRKTQGYVLLPAEENHFEAGKSFTYIDFS